MCEREKRTHQRAKRDMPHTRTKYSKSSQIRISLVTLIDLTIKENRAREKKHEEIPGGHDVVVVDQLQKGLDLAALGDFLLRHTLGHLCNSERKKE